MLVAVVQVVGTQRCVEVVHQGDIGRVVQRCTLGNQRHLEQYAFGVFVALFSQEYLMTFFVEREVPGFGDTLTGTRVGLALLAR